MLYPLCLRYCQLCTDALPGCFAAGMLCGVGGKLLRSLLVKAGVVHQRVYQGHLGHAGWDGVRGWGVVDWRAVREMVRRAGGAMVGEVEAVAPALRTLTGQERILQMGDDTVPSYRKIG